MVLGVEHWDNILKHFSFILFLRYPLELIWTRVDFVLDLTIRVHWNLWFIKARWSYFFVTILGLFWLFIRRLAWRREIMTFYGLFNSGSCLVAHRNVSHLTDFIFVLKNLTYIIYLSKELIVRSFMFRLIVSFFNNNFHWLILFWSFRFMMILFVSILIFLNNQISHPHSLFVSLKKLTLWWIESIAVLSRRRCEIWISADFMENWITFILSSNKFILVVIKCIFFWLFIYLLWKFW